MKYLGRKIASIVGSLWDMRKVINNNLRSSVYNALVNSHLSYGISVWGCGGSENKLKPLFVLQKKCLRNLFKIRRESKFVKGHTKTTFNKNGILTVHNLYNYFTLSDISKLYHLKLPKYLYNLLNIDNTKQRIDLPLLSTSHYQNNFAYQGPKLWNLLLPYVKDKKFELPKTLRSFKAKFKSFLLKMQSDEFISTWTSTNFDIQLYISKSKSDPYFYESMNKTALDTISKILN